MQTKLDPEKAITWLRQKLPFKLAPLQEEAVRQALTEKVLVITGGPGTGKTTLIRAVLAILSPDGCAHLPGGAHGTGGQTFERGHPLSGQHLHRLLEYSPHLGGFQRNEQRPLTADLVIVDEASMLDILLMHHLLKAIPSHATLVLVGDVDQLPVGGPRERAPGYDHGPRRFPVVRLTEIFRQAQTEPDRHQCPSGAGGKVPASADGSPRSFRTFISLRKKSRKRF